MTTIAATSPEMPKSGPVAPAVAANAPARSADTGSAAGPPPPPDAVVVSLSEAARAAPAYPADKTAEQRVDSLMDKVKSHNALADVLAHTDWTVAEKYVSQEVSEKNKTEIYKALYISSEVTCRDLGKSGIDARTASDEQVMGAGVAPGTLFVQGFSFKEGGSTYAVAAGENGTLVGTRDGQAWKTWKPVPAHGASPVDPTAAEAALATLRGLLSPGKPGGGTGSSLGLIQLNV